jgi:hypothetical protein
VFDEWHAPACVLGLAPAQYPDNYKDWRRHRVQNPDAALPGGESLTAFRDRALDAIQSALRAHHEPYNPHHRIVGFDTFTGFPGVSGKDSTRSAVPGRFAVAREYPDHLREVLAAHERLEPLGHIQRTLVVEGDVRETLPHCLEDNPHTVVALAYFDLDLYEPLAWEG